MVAGEAGRRATLAPGTRYLALDKFDRPHWEPLFEGNPHMARPGEPHDGTIGYVNGTRAYIAHLAKERYTFREYEPHPAVIVVPKQSSVGHGRVVFNPTVKPRAPINKQWAGWSRLIADNPEIHWLQIGEAGPFVKDAEFIRTPTLWDALAVIAGADAVVCHEGALHHAAAGLDVPCVVIRGGFISPKVTGYAGQADLFVYDERYPLGCGMRLPCEHCREAMASISTEDVMDALHSVLRKESVAA